MPNREQRAQRISQRQRRRQRSRRSLIRRATFDLTGLPPTPEEVEAFLRDSSDRAYERLGELVGFSDDHTDERLEEAAQLAEAGNSAGALDAVIGMDASGTITAVVDKEALIRSPRYAPLVVLRDISRAHHYVPGIVDTKIVSDMSEGVGASRYVYRNARSYIQETVEEWHEGEGFLIRLHRGDKPAPPFRAAWFRYALEDAGDQQTRLTTTMIYELPWGPLGRWLEPRLAKVVEKTIGDVACALKLFYETGEPTTPAALKAFKAKQ